MALAPQDHDDIVISFGDDEGSVSTPQVTKFEIVSQWKRVLQDFCQVEPLAGAYLENTTLQRGDFHSQPFPLRILFRGDCYFNHLQITQNPAYPKSLQDYLETILQTRVDLLFELMEASPGEAAAQSAARMSQKSSPAASFERDKEREPILALLAETFETTWVHTRTLQRQAPVIVSGDDDCEVESNED